MSNVRLQRRAFWQRAAPAVLLRCSLRAVVVPIAVVVAPSRNRRRASLARSSMRRRASSAAAACCPPRARRISLDPHQTNAGVIDVWHNYSPLFKISEGYLKNSNGDIEGELVDSWEFSPDKTQLTLKITKDVAFAPLPPVNGRAVDARDVEFSWKRYNAVSPRKNSSPTTPTRPRQSFRSTRSTTKRW